MNGLRIIPFIFFTLFMVSPDTTAADTLTFQKSVTTETGRELTIPEKTILDPYLYNNDYQYGNDSKAPKGYGILGSFFRAVSRLIASGLKYISVLPWVFRILLITGIVIMVYFIVARTSIHRVIYREEKIHIPDYEEMNANHSGIEIDMTISNEIARQNFRNAIRLMHLKILKCLNEKRIINISRDKTNRDYSFEITDRELRYGFVSVTDIYNRIWYGQQVISKEDFNSMRASFDIFTNKLLNVKK